MKADDIAWACGTYREKRNSYSFLIGKPGEGDLLEDLGVD
jgi:hypothetical protein